MKGTVMTLYSGIMYIVIYKVGIIYYYIIRFAAFRFTFKLINITANNRGIRKVIFTMTRSNRERLMRYEHHNLMQCALLYIIIIIIMCGII